MSPEYPSPESATHSEEEEGEPRTGRRGDRRQRRRRARSRSRRFLVLVAIAVVALLAVATGGVILLTDDSPEPGRLIQTYPDTYVGAPSAKAAGRFHRAVDQRPLQPTEVFDADVGELRHGGVTLRLAGKHASDDCSTVAWGGRLRQSLQSFGCTQVIRGLYRSADDAYLAQFIVLNLNRVQDANQLITRLDPHRDNGFLSPLTTAETPEFGDGFSNAHASAFGHYVVLAWVQRADGAEPDGARELMTVSITVQQADSFVWERLSLTEAAG